MPAIRYYDDEGNRTNALDLSSLGKALHSLYTRWVAENGHRRDFQCALQHSVGTVLIEYHLQGKPTLTGVRPVLPPVPRTAPPKKPFNESPVRFYDEDCILTSKLTYEDHHTVLAGHFVDWLEQGGAFQDFEVAVRNLAVCIVYDHELAMSLGGLGGGPSAEDFLTREYKG